jgi:hypothetical protein
VTRPDDDITVHRCTVRVVRRGGWSWGPDPRLLADRVLDALPDLLAARFAEQLASGADVEITEPVVLPVRLGLGDLAARTSSPGAAGPRVEVFPLPEPVPPLGRREEDAVAPRPAPPAEPVPVRVARLFAELAERGDLAPLLALLPDESLRSCLRALLPAADRSAPGDDVAAVLALVLAEAALRVGPAPRTAAGADQRPLAGAPGPDEAARLLAALPGPAEPERPAGPPEPARATARDEVRVHSALPFLLLGPLARTGYLDAVGPAFAAADLAGETALFAVALAYEVLGVPARGWRRDERDRRAAAAFAGLDQPVPDEALVELSRLATPALPVLDGVLALSLCRGHDPADPLLLTGEAGGLLLVDAGGLFPIAWADDVETLLVHWRACGRPPVLLCAGPLPPGCVAALVAAGVPFATAIRPVRGEPLRRLLGPRPVWAHGDPGAVADLPEHTAALSELVRALVTDRRAVPLADDPRLERSATLAAALGLGTTAWLLWRDREATGPVLALDRFADLDALVRFEADAVRVRLPLGRRHADLLRAGLLADVTDVVWLGGRTLTFSGG